MTLNEGTTFGGNDALKVFSSKVAEEMGGREGEKEINFGLEVRG